MGPVREKSLKLAMDAVSADSAPKRALTPLVAQFPTVETTTMKSRGDTWRLAARVGFILVSGAFSWLLVALVIRLFT